MNGMPVRSINIPGWTSFWPLDPFGGVAQQTKAVEVALDVVMLPNCINYRTSKKHESVHVAMVACEAQ